MGDFVGGMLKYLRDHPVPRVTIAGGPAKITKLAQGRLDLHSKRGAVDVEALAAWGGNAVRQANTVAEAFEQAGPDLAGHVAQHAWRIAADVLAGSAAYLEIVIFDRNGKLLGRAVSSL
jgi:cobalt-precorrin-5B (C1)-methyltransferase